MSMWRRITDIWPNLRIGREHEGEEPNQYELMNFGIESKS